MAKAGITKVNPKAAMLALQNADWDRQKAYSEYIRLHFQSTGQLAPKCDNKDLIAYYDKAFRELYAASRDVTATARRTGEVNGLSLEQWAIVPRGVMDALEKLFK